MEKEVGYLQCEAGLLERFKKLMKRSFISTFYQPCTNVIEAAKVHGSVCYHIDPECLCKLDDPRVLYLTNDGARITTDPTRSLEAMTELLQSTEDFSELRLEEQALLHSYHFRKQIVNLINAETLAKIEKFHYNKAKTRAFAICLKRSFSTVYLVAEPCNQAFEAACRARNMLRRCGLESHVCYFGTSITEEKMYNVRQDNSVFVTVATCPCRNVPWFELREHRDVLSFYELLCRIGALDTGLEYETLLEPMLVALEAYVERAENNV